MSFIRRAGRHARTNVVAYLALFVALGGTSAYAANTIGSADIIDDSIQSVDLKDGQVKAADIGSNQITTAKIYPGSVTNSDIGTGAVTPNKLSTAPAASVMRLTGETAHSAQGTTLHADYEFFDTAALHDGMSENLVAPVAGTYVVSATVEWDPSGTGYRRSSIVSNNSGAFASVAGPPLPAPAYTSQQMSGIERLAAGQIVRVEVLQGSGADLNVRLARFQMTLAGGY